MTDGLSSHLWQSTWFALAAGLLALAFRNNRAKVRYCLWVSASFKFLFPFAPLMTLGSHLGTAPVARRIAAPVFSVAVQRLAEPFPVGVSYSPVPHTTPVNWLPAALFAVWACGVLAIGLVRLRWWLRIRAALRSATPLDIPAAVEIRS